MPVNCSIVHIEEVDPLTHKWVCSFYETCGSFRKLVPSTPPFLVTEVLKAHNDDVANAFQNVPLLAQQTRHNDRPS